MVATKKVPGKDSTRPIYYKTISPENIIVDEESRVVKFYAAIWGNIDDAGDILVKGCCARSIEARGPESKTNRKITFLYQHDVKDPIGKPVVLKENEKGLYVESPIDEVPSGDRTLTQLKSGTLNQFSIGYMYVWDKCEWTEVDDPSSGTKRWALVCKEIELFEVSVVTFGCNEETGFEGMKDNEIRSQKNQLKRDTEALLKSLSPDKELQVRQLISKHIALSLVDPATPPLNEPDPQKKKSVDFQLLFNLKN